MALRFAFNFYRHFLQFLIWVPGDRTPRIILIKEGFMQGDPMAMPLYSVSVAIPDEQLKRELPALIQVWYDNDFSTTSRRRAARPLMQRLGRIVPSSAVSRTRKSHNTSAWNRSQKRPPNLPPPSPP